MKLRVLPALIVFLLAALPALAQPQADAVKAADTPQGQFIQNLGNRAVAILADKTLGREEQQQQFREMLRTHFDLMTIGRFVIGRTWNSATPQQQQDYSRLFEELVIKSYSDQFALYAGEGFKVANVRAEGERDSIVNSVITHPDGSPDTSVDWRIRDKNGKLGIIDVVVEGISMSVTQRQDYSSVIQRNGGNIDALLDLMRQRLAGPAAKQAEKG
jgi:phospholipid transport system substrate-binding protein